MYPRHPSDLCLHPVVSRPSAQLAVQYTCFLFRAGWLSFKILGTQGDAEPHWFSAECLAVLRLVQVCPRRAIAPTHRSMEFRVMPSKESVSSFASLSGCLGPYSKGQRSAMVPTSTFVPWEVVPALSNALQEGGNIFSSAPQGILRA